MAEWRLILDPPRPGPLNMATDEALMQAQGDGNLPPTIRLYSWQPACMSIGYFQRAGGELDLEACSQAGVDVVRRPTGGRAVLHDDEITYSVTIRQELLPGGVLETYQKLSQGILQGLRYLGIEGELARLTRPGRRPRPEPAATSPPAETEDGPQAACFDSPSWYEALVGGRKIIGSAQTRASGVILQHGSLLMSFDAERLAALLRAPSAAARARLTRHLDRRVTSVSEQLRRRPRPGEVEGAMVAGVAAALGVSLVQGGYSDRELLLTQQLWERKYATEQWTMRR